MNRKVFNSDNSYVTFDSQEMRKLLSQTSTRISNSYSIRQSFQGYRCKSGIAGHLHKQAFLSRNRIWKLSTFWYKNRDISIFFLIQMFKGYCCESDIRPALYDSQQYLLNINRRKANFFLIYNNAISFFTI